MKSPEQLEAIVKLIAEISIAESHVRSAEYQTAMVYVVFNDGEISCTKAGSLLWLRSLHCFVNGDAAKVIPVEMFPHRFCDFGVVFCTGDNADKLASLIHERPISH